MLVKGGNGILGTRKEHFTRLGPLGETEPRYSSNPTYKLVFRFPLNSSAAFCLFTRLPVNGRRNVLDTSGMRNETDASAKVHFSQTLQ